MQIAEIHSKPFMAYMCPTKHVVIDIKMKLQSGGVCAVCQHQNTMGGDPKIEDHTIPVMGVSIRYIGSEDLLFVRLDELAEMERSPDLITLVDLSDGMGSAPPPPSPPVEPEDKFIKEDYGENLFTTKMDLFSFARGFAAGVVFCAIAAILSTF